MTSRPVTAFAHRGGALHPEILGLENTVAAFRHAVELGYRHLETDVHLSRDGVLVAFHDASLDRTTDRSGPLAGQTAAEIAQARVGGREHVPTLAELVETFPEARFNIDLKAPGTPAAMAAFIDERGLHDRMTVCSFTPRYLAEFRRASSGRVATAAHPGEIAAFLGSPSARLSRLLVRDRISSLQIPHTRTVAGRRFPIATRGLIRRAQAVGVAVYVWTIDDPDEMRVLLDRGVDGLMTDRTDILKAVLVDRGQWEG